MRVEPFLVVCYDRSDFEAERLRCGWVGWKFMQVVFTKSGSVMPSGLFPRVDRREVWVTDLAYRGCFFLGFVFRSGF